LVECEDGRVRTRKTFPAWSKSHARSQAPSRLDADGPPFQLCICDAYARIIAAASVSGFEQKLQFDSNPLIAEASSVMRDGIAHWRARLARAGWPAASGLRTV
jgi:hypothetical protein